MAFLVQSYGFFPTYASLPPTNSGKISPINHCSALAAAMAKKDRDFRVIKDFKVINAPNDLIALKFFLS